MVRDHPGIVAGLAISALLGFLFAVFSAAASGSDQTFSHLAFGAALIWCVLAGVTDLIYRRGLVRAATLLAWLPCLLLVALLLASGASAAAGMPRLHA
jgi:hypothetical protein